MKKKVCRYCDKEYKFYKGYRVDMCPACTAKAVQMRRFAKVRDDLRERLGLERLGTNEDL